MSYIPLPYRDDPPPRGVLLAVWLGVVLVSFAGWYGITEGLFALCRWFGA